MRPILAVVFNRLYKQDYGDETPLMQSRSREKLWEETKSTIQSEKKASLLFPRKDCNELKHAPTPLMTPPIGL